MDSKYCVLSIKWAALSTVPMCHVIELVPAQAPYNMRGLFSGYVTHPNGALFYSRKFHQ